SSDVCSSDLLNVAADTAQCGPVAPRIFEERGIFRDPDIAPSTLKPIVEDAGRNLPAFPRAGAIAQEETLAIDVPVFGKCQANAFLVRLESARDGLGPGVPGIDDRLELGGGEEP